MGRRIAIVLGVPEYESQAALPCCKADAHAFSAMLDESERFDEILLASGDLPGAGVREEITDFFRRNQRDEVEELVFYFSGHGGVLNGEFRFALRDFSKSRPNSTSLTNEEVDTFARSVAPRLYCKVVDACHSGISYVKDADVLKDMLQNNTSVFEHCYFFFSSHNDQPSFAGDELSDFTRALLESVVNHPADAITYHDLAGAVADRFIGMAAQTPFFVEQAKLTEQFLQIESAARERLRALIPSAPADAVGTGANAGSTTDHRLLDQVRLDAERYLERMQVDTFLSDLRTALDGGKLPSDLSQLYDTSLEELHRVEVGQQHIAKWLSEKEEDEVFARVNHRIYYTDVTGHELDADELSELRSRARNRFVSPFLAALYTQRREIEGFSLTETGPWWALALTASPRFPNLPKWVVQISYVLGPTTITVFRALSQHPRSGWDSYGAARQVDWRVETITSSDLKDPSLVERVLASLREQIVDQIMGSIEW